MTWIRTPPPTELVEYFSRTTGAKGETSDVWKALLKGSGLRDIVVRIYKVNTLREIINGIRWLGLLGLKDYSRAWSNFLALCIRSPAFRRYIKETWPALKNVKNIFEYLGYEIYVGRK